MQPLYRMIYLFLLQTLLSKTFRTRLRNGVVSTWRSTIRYLSKPEHADDADEAPSTGIVSIKSICSTAFQSPLFCSHPA